MTATIRSWNAFLKTNWMIGTTAEGMSFPVYLMGMASLACYLLSIFNIDFSVVGKSPVLARAGALGMRIRKGLIDCRTREFLQNQQGDASGERRNALKAGG